eukprot:Gb_35116 [translate_table: standard]
MGCDGMTLFSANAILTVQNQNATEMNASSTPPEFQGAQLSSRFESGNGKKRANFDICEENSTEEDDCFKQGEKKKRLDIEQVRTLERNFELGSRLEPGRKLKLAKALGLQPRQIAIWFQNRRARCRTKQLEKDFDVLRQDYEAFKSVYHKLQEENKRLQDEIQRLSSVCENKKQKIKYICMDAHIGLTGNKENGDTQSEVACLKVKLEQGACQKNIPQAEGSWSEEELCSFNLDEQTGLWCDHWPQSLF